MLDPYKMVLVNVILSSIVVVIYYAYQNIYPKKKINLFVLLVILSLLVCVSIFRVGIYESGDFLIHLYRSIEFFNAIQDGQLLPSWAGGLNATYGYPLFIFNYTLPYYVISLFHFLGFSFITSMKLFLAINFILSGIFMYLFTKNLFKNDQTAFIVTIFYQFAPYHLIDLHFKVVIGEILIFTLLPLVFFTIQKLWYKKSIFWVCAASLSVSLLIMSHVVLALFSMLLLLSYAIFLSFKEKRKQYVTSTLLVLFFGVISSCYVWLTPFFMTKYTLFKTAEDFVYFPQFWELLFAPWRLGFLYQGHKGELSFLLGYTHIVTFVGLTILLFSNKLFKKYRMHTIFWLLILLVIVFLITPFSKFLWGLIPFLKVTGSHRLLVLAVFVLALLAGYFSLHMQKKKNLLFVLVVVTVFSTILNWGHRHMYTNVSEKNIINNVWKSTSQIEGHFYANSKWRSMNDPWFKTLPKSYLETSSGSAQIKSLKRNSIYHSYVVSAATNSAMQENTLYFPGWNVKVNDVLLKNEPNKEGLISFNLPQGLYYVEVFYDDILIYKTLKTISISSFVILFCYLLFSLLSGMRIRKLLSRFFRNYQ